jgi:hypothetical protein
MGPAGEAGPGVHGSKGRCLNPNSFWVTLDASGGAIGHYGFPSNAPCLNLLVVCGNIFVATNAHLVIGIFIIPDQLGWVTDRSAATINRRFIQVVASRSGTPGDQFLAIPVVVALLAIISKVDGMREGHSGSQRFSCQGLDDDIAHGHAHLILCHYGRPANYHKQGQHY